MNVTLTDSRPWYKQVITGIFLLLNVIIKLIVFVGICFGLYGVYKFIGLMSLSFIQVLVILASLVVAVVLIILLFMVHHWAKHTDEELNKSHW